MLKCAKCGADTIVEIDGVPICVECDRKNVTERKPPKSSYKPTTLRCPTCQNLLVQPERVSPLLAYAPVRCLICSFTGFRVKDVVFPDKKRWDSWKNWNAS